MNKAELTVDTLDQSDMDDCGGDRMLASITSILIVDDDPLVRGALELMLGGQQHLNLVGTASNGDEAITMARQYLPDIVLMDIRMPIRNGLEATLILAAEPRPPQVIMLTTFDADEHVLGAIEAGAAGFLLKDTPPAEIVAAIDKVAAGEPMLSPSATRVLLTRIREGKTEDRSVLAAAQLAALTPREQEVAIAVGQGLSNSEIAAQLFMSVPTVKAHLSRVFDKLGVANRVQIAICVHEAGALTQET